MTDPVSLQNPIAPTPPAATKAVDKKQSSCSGLNLSWLNERVMDVALDAKHLSLSDMKDFHSSISAAEEFGNLDMDSSARLHEKIDRKEAVLRYNMVKKEFKHVTKTLQIFRLLKTHKTWEQVIAMADSHGQGAYILMKEFKGLEPDNVKAALSNFYTQIKAHNNKLPFTDNVEASAMDTVRKNVAAKLCRAYRGFLHSLNNRELGGYDQAFIQETVLYNVDDLMQIWNVTEIDLGPEDDLQKQAEEDKILADKTDDENSDQEDEDNDNDLDGTYRSDDDYDYYDDDAPSGRYYHSN